LDDKQREVLALLRTEEIRFAELIDASEGLEAIFLDEGRRTEEKRQHVTTLTAKRELKRVRADTRTVKLGGHTIRALPTSEAWSPREHKSAKSAPLRGDSTTAKNRLEA
jgi:hypothetical protein